MNRLPLSFFVLFFIIYSACRVTKSKDGLKGVETSYLDSFEVRLPYYVINSKMIEEKLDSIILFVESCDEYQRNGKDYPTFLYLSTIDTGIKLIEIKASRNHVSLLDPDGFS